MVTQQGRINRAFVVGIVEDRQIESRLELLRPTRPAGMPVLLLRQWIGCGIQSLAYQLLHPVPVNSLLPHSGDSRQGNEEENNSLVVFHNGVSFRCGFKMSFHII